MKYTVIIHFDNPEDCAWFSHQITRHREMVAQGSQLEGGGRGILMAALGRSTRAQSTMSLEQIKAQIRGVPAKVEV